MLLFHEVCHSSKIYLLIDGIKLENGILKEVGVCRRLDFNNIKLFNFLGYNFNIYGAFEFLCNSIANL